MTQITKGGNDTLSIPARYEVPLTAFSIDLSVGASELVINPAGTLATGTVILPVNPEEGRIFSMVSTQTQTALTVTVGTGDTLVGAITALVANTPVRRRFSKKDNTGADVRRWITV